MVKVKIGENLDQTGDLGLEIIKKRVVKGVAVLTGRTFFLQIVSFQFSLS